MKGILVVMIGIFICFLIGISLVDDVADGVATAKEETNVTGILDTLLDIWPLLFVCIPIVGVFKLFQG